MLEHQATLQDNSLSLYNEYPYIEQTQQRITSNAHLARGSSPKIIRVPLSITMLQSHS